MMWIMGEKKQQGTDNEAHRQIYYDTEHKILNVIGTT